MTTRRMVLKRGFENSPAGAKVGRELTRIRIWLDRPQEPEKVVVAWSRLDVRKWFAEWHKKNPGNNLIVYR